MQNAQEACVPSAQSERLDVKEGISTAGKASRNSTQQAGKRGSRGYSNSTTSFRIAKLECISLEPHPQPREMEKLLPRAPAKPVGELHDTKRKHLCFGLPIFLY
jgi:hypothetical protein